MSKKEETKEKIIRATLQIAAEKGFSSTRTAEIAQVAGISEGLIFKYFPTKNHLFASIINDNFQRLKAGIELIINNPLVSAGTKLKNLIDFHFNFFTDERNIAQLIFNHFDKKGLDFSIGPVIEYGIKPYSQLITRILSEGVGTGEFRPVNEEIIAIVMIGSMQVTLAQKFLFKSNFSLEEAKQEIISYFLGGIRAEAVSGR